MNHSSANFDQYYCLTVPQELLQGSEIPVYSDMKDESHSITGFAKLVDMDLLAMRKVRQGKIDRDWERVCHLSVSVPKVGHWLFPEDDSGFPLESSQRQEFIGLIEQYAGNELAQYFNEYFHQQGFDALPRTIVNTLLQQQYNQYDAKSIKSLKEVANGHGVATYFTILAPGIIGYQMYNAYSHQREDCQDENIPIQERELPLYVRLTGQIAYDQGIGSIKHELKELSFIVNQEYQDDLKDFFSRSETHMRSDFLKLFAAIPKKELPRFLVEAHISESQNLIDFTQRFLAGAINMRRSRSPKSVQDIEQLSIDIENLSDKVILKPVSAHVERSQHAHSQRKNI